MYFDDAMVSTEETLFFARSGLQTKQIRKLRRGQFEIEAELDLHGLTVVETEETLAAFLERCQAQHQRHLCIIHGKGARAILKNFINNQLRQLDQVLAFCSAKPVDGGNGAVYVLLKSSKRVQYD